MTPRLSCPHDGVAFGFTIGLPAHAQLPAAEHLSYDSCMAYALGVLAVAFLVVLLAAFATGRVRMSSCCSLSAADPRRDIRMAAAFADAPVEGRDAPR